MKGNNPLLMLVKTRTGQVMDYPPWSGKSHYTAGHTRSTSGSEKRPWTLWISSGIAEVYDMSYLSCRSKLHRWLVPADHGPKKCRRSDLMRKKGRERYNAGTSNVTVGGTTSRGVCRS